MALTKQTLIIILISANLIFVNVHSSPFPAAPSDSPTKKKKEDSKEEYDNDDSSPFPAPSDSPTKKKKEDSKKKKKESKEDDDDSDDSSEFSLPDIDDITKPDKKGGSQSNVAKIVSKQMQIVEKKIFEFNEILKKRLEPGTEHGTQECVSECDEVFGAAIDDIKKTLDSLESENLMKANFDISAVSTNVDTCNDCFDEMVGGDSDVKKLGDWVRKITGDALEDLQKATE